ncbi:MAG: L,D-transpeptidase family protein [Sedimenticola sp.]
MTQIRFRVRDGNLWVFAVQTPSMEYLIRYPFRPLPVVILSVLLSCFCWSGAGAGVQQRSVEDVVERYRVKVALRLYPRFRFADVAWPPQEAALVAFKDTRRLELWVRDEGEWVYIKEYRIKGISGRPGPKLQEGDRQVPEGGYRIELLNPNSAFHLSLKLNYPNAFDRERAQLDGRSNLGGDIFIHGDRVSSGCLAMGDNAVEELFVLTAMMGVEKVSVLISPRDFRFRPALPPPPGTPAWVPGLHRRIADNLRQFPLELK